jgi:ribosomal protein S18 acetylase RimI-like enzyme
MGISIRKATIDDIEIIKDMFYHAIYIPNGQPRPSKEVVNNQELRKYYKEWGKPGDLGYIAYTNDGAVGAVWIRLLKDEQKGYGYVDDNTPELSIAVLPEFRNQGLGSKLLNVIINDARSIYGTISLSVTKGNPARQLYERLGFIELSENENDKIMIKDLRK